MWILVTYDRVSTTLTRAHPASQRRRSSMWFSRCSLMVRRAHLQVADDRLVQPVHLLVRRPHRSRQAEAAEQPAFARHTRRPSAPGLAGESRALHSGIASFTTVPRERLARDWDGLAHEEGEVRGLFSPRS